MLRQRFDRLLLRAGTNLQTESPAGSEGPRFANGSRRIACLSSTGICCYSLVLARRDGRAGLPSEVVGCAGAASPEGRPALQPGRRCQPGEVSPVIECSRIGAKMFPVHSLIRCALRFLVFLVLSSSGTLLYAQTIEIKLVNGRNGSPLPRTCVNVWVGSERKQAMAIPTDENGVAKLRLTDKDSEVDVRRDWKVCGDFGVIDPVVKYNDSIRINVSYVLCQPHTPDYSWLSLTTFSMERLIQRGIVTPNSCGKATASPKSGEVVIFARPLSFWEKLKL
jgi:hypothetical protein